MSALLLILGSAGIGVIWAVAHLRHLQRRHYDHMRRVYVAHFPRELEHKAVLNFVRALSGLPHPGFLQHVHTVVFDTYADANGIKHYLSIPGHVVADVESLFRTHIAGGTLVKADVDLVTEGQWDKVAELGTSNAYVPLRIGDAGAAAATLLSRLAPLKEGQAVLIQWVISPRHHQGIPQSRENWFATEIDPHKAKEKLAEPNFLAVGRLASKGESSESLIRRLYAGLASVHTHRMKFTRQAGVASHIRERIRRRSGMLAFPAILNAYELSVVIGYPFGDPNIPGLDHAKHLKADLIIPPTGAVTLGTSTFPGDERPVAIPMSGLLMHKWVLGPTGSGKSVLLLNDAVSLMNAGYGLVVIEPKGDLARDVLMRVPQHRINDVIWFDPTDVNKPIGLNVLAGPDPEVTADHLMSFFKKRYHNSWGARLEWILRYTFLTCAYNGLTLWHAKQLLVNTEFRDRIVRKTSDGEVRQFWRKYSDDKHDSDFDSALNKLDTFVGFSTTRNILAQQDGLKMRDVVRNHKILLVPLDAAVIGAANADIIGSSIVDKFWNEAQLRPVDRRPPVPLMIDEFQRFVNTNMPFEDMMALARSYATPLIFANQDTHRVKDVLDALNTNMRNKVVFGTDPFEAKRIESVFPPLTAADLSSLPQYTAAVRVMTAQGLAPTTIVRTPPPPELSGFGIAAREASRAKYGRDVLEIEADLAESRKTSADSRKRPSIG